MRIKDSGTSFSAMSAGVEIRRLNTSYNLQVCRQKTTQVYCRQCGCRVTVGGFAVHLRDHHALNCETACPFCYGKVSWQKGAIGREVGVASHRKQCLRTFLKTHKRAPRLVAPVVDKVPPKVAEVPLLPSEEIRVYTEVIPEAHASCPTCYAHNQRGAVPSMDGRVRHVDEWGDSFYEPIRCDPLFLQDRGPTHVRFSEESGLGLVAYNIFQCFLSGEYVFFHLMVRARVWMAFFMTSWPCVHFLPYSCLCDGRHATEEEEEDRVHHRHLLVAMIPEAVPLFMKAWRKVVPRLPGRRRQQRNKLCMAIENESHLLYAMAYVSRPRATCDGYGNEGSRGSHYWIFRELSPCAPLALGALWKKGHLSLVSRRHRASDLSAYYYHVERRDQAWQVQLVYLGMKEKQCVLPVAREYELCDEWAEDRPVVYMYGRAKYLRRVPELSGLRYDAWLRHQRATGNCMWECVGQEYYALEQHQTRCMNVVNKVVEGVQSSFDREEIRMMSEMSQWRREAMDHADETKRVLGELELAQSDVRTAQSALRTAQSELKSTQSEWKSTQSELKSTQSELKATQKALMASEKREKHAQVRMDELDAEVRRVRDKCVAQLEEMNREYRERLRVSEDTVRAYQEKIEKLDEELREVHADRSQERVEQLERALQVVSSWYVELRHLRPSK